ncbi:ribonuclease P protein component [Myceligenerans pegani]|uniref:Ribonuclease P protein component n=1 Tax=Myceligenerans pegani TaxID=2776917 RepID=A0ABR9N1H8_9MICO|nr:ribonuclease P protein component [Myceligenerans sp. TRM 65318]MBE1877512.1 ribonuclease P protein component [Myceligenerans sp. TRM 65318]MBE3019783.1 ribonuclease P protein component [Myceligenerans sp. TRM 65318]
MLPAAHRLRRSVDFERTVRRGTRAGRPTLVVHLLTGTGDGSADPPQVGLVVSKAVGNAVHRNKVKRRIRASAARHVGELPRGARVVVRALPPSATASYHDLDEDLGSCLHRAVRKASRGTGERRRPLAQAGVGRTGSTVDPAAEPANSTNGGTSA